jgi:hypothetical protein
LILALWAAAASAAAPAPTGDPARLAAAREMMQVAGVARQFEEVMPVLTRHLGQSFMALAPEKAKEIEEVIGQLSTRFVQRKAELIDQIAGLYAQELTLEELTAIVDFYKSPVGTKLMTVQPRITRQSMALGQRWGAEIGRELEAEVRRELKKRGVDL